MINSSDIAAQSFERLERLAPLGYFSMGIGWVSMADDNGHLQQMLAIANGSDWTPQPITLHPARDSGSFQPLPTWFSDDYDHHMGLAVGDVTGNGYDDLIVAVFAGKNQSLSEGGVKLYEGGPEGLSTKPKWLARGFSATGVALGDLRGTGKRDIVVSCLSEQGTIQEPHVDHLGRFTGHARLLENESSGGIARFEVVLLDHPAARGCGDVTLADVNGNGELDLVFAGQRTTVIYGPMNFEAAEPWEDCSVWISEEEHPFSFSALAFENPHSAGKQLIASSRGLLSATQLKGRSLGEVQTGVLIHSPTENRMTCAVQHLAALNEERPEVPAGLAVSYDEQRQAHLVAGFLDARGRDIRGAALRVFKASNDDDVLPFAQPQGRRLPGGGLMAGRVATRPRVSGPTSVWKSEIRIDDRERRVLNLPSLPIGEVLSVAIHDSAGVSLPHRHTRTGNGRALCFSPPLPAGATVSLSIRASEEVEIAAASSAAWPPAGASGFWRGRLSEAAVQSPTRTLEMAPKPHDSRPARSVRQAG